MGSEGENEIDLVCEDELTGSLDIYEVKREAKRYDENALKLKAEAFLRRTPRSAGSRCPMRDSRSRM